jgi:tetratricopeptide (TPR) repeat protein
VLALQEEVATDITKQLSIELTPQERIVLKNAQAVSPEAHEAYLRGRYFWAKRGTADDIQKATRYFKQATQDDPHFAPAYAALAETYAVAPDYSSARPTESYDRAEAAANQALAIDAASVEAHVALALVAGNKDFDWQLSESEFQRALDLNPGYANAHHWHAFNLMFLGRLDEALAEMEHARKLDPLSIIINANVGFVLYSARQWDRAIEAEQKFLELDPNSPDIHRYLGLALLQQGKYEEALSNLQRAVDLSGAYAEYAAELSYAYAAAGNRVRAQKILADLERRSHGEYVPSFSLAVAYTGLGEKAAALARLQSAVDEHCDLIPTLKVNPLFDTLRSEPRFTELLRRIRLAT